MSVEGDAELSGGGPFVLRMIPMLTRGPTMLLSGVFADDDALPENQNCASVVPAHWLPSGSLRVASLFG
jgi:hypothetical protein